MGLDMYAYSRDANGPESTPFISDIPPLATWRKHNRLHGWMEELWRKRGPSEGPFNMVELELTKVDLEQLAADLASGSLPKTGGFFFGPDSEGFDRLADLKFVGEALKALEDGKQVFYNSWW